MKDWEAAYGISTGTNFDDLEWPCTTVTLYYEPRSVEENEDGPVLSAAKR